MLGSTGKYQLESRLGGGGMAEVFIGRSTGAEGFSRKVAIKRVLGGLSENPDFARMFVSEAQLTSRLVHPNIVSVLDFDRDNEQRLFLVMELIEGKDLGDLMGSGILPLPVVVYVTCEVLRGLGYAHNLPTGDEGPRGVIHRDISPHNVLLSWEGAVKVSDFGIAKARAASNVTASAFIKGKPAYMSPEQANGTHLDGRSDLFAVGIILWEMLVGQRLFVGGTTQETLAKVLFQPVPWPHQHRPNVPSDLEHVTMKLLSKRVDDRYPSAEDALAELLACECAPKSGRDELMHVLADRFPEHAPQRVRRPLASGGSAPVAVLSQGPDSRPINRGVSDYPPADGRPPELLDQRIPDGRKPPSGRTVPIGAAGQSASALGASGPRTVDPNAATMVAVPVATANAPQAEIAQLMSARTRTLQPGASDQPRPKTRRYGWIIGGTALATFAGLIAVFALQQDRTAASSPPSDAPGPAGALQPTPTQTQPVVTVPTNAMPVHDARIDAPAPDAAATAPVDAPTATATIDAKAAESDPPKRPGCTFDRDGRKGTLVVSVNPWAEVFVNGKKIGTAPQNLSLPPGCHRVRLTKDGGYDESFKVTIQSGRTKTIERDWR